MTQQDTGSWISLLYLKGGHYILPLTVRTAATEGSAGPWYVDIQPEFRPPSAGCLAS